MRYIPLKESNRAALKEWSKKADEIVAELKAEPDRQKRLVIIRKNQTHWRNKELIKFLKSLSNGKCWYTEVKFSAEYPYLEHFRPKTIARDEHGKRKHDGYWWLAFDVENYRLSKPLPNTWKGCYFPLQERELAVCAPDTAVTREIPMFLDPTEEEDVELIGFNALGKPEPCQNPIADIGDWDKKRIEFSIKRYGLDDKELCDQRKELWVSLTAQLNEYTALYLKAKTSKDILAKGQAKEKLKNIKTYLSSEHDFTSLIKACLDNHSTGKMILKSLAIYQKAA